MKLRSLFVCFAAATLILCACAPESVETPHMTEPVQLEASTATSTPTEPPEPTSTPEPTPLVQSREGRVFTYYGDDPGVPVVPHSPAARWDGKYINPGAVLIHDGIFHMFRNGFKNWPGLVSVGYMTSSDGLTWTEAQTEPVFTSEQVPYVEDGEGADVSSAVVMDDGTWVFYFHRVSTPRPAVIGRASASSPTGPWTIDPEPVLVPGEDGAWDDYGVAWPSVLRSGDEFYMYYAGKSGQFGDSMIGLATSSDGVHWTKHDDPSTTDDLFADSDPVLPGEEAWATQGVDRARVVSSPEAWVMIYQGGALVKRGLAFSQDGVGWQVHPENPVIELGDFPLTATMWDTALVQRDGVYYYYTELGSSAGTDIYLAVHEGEIVPPGFFGE